MENDKVKELVESRLPGAIAEVTGDGRHFEISVISEQFAGKSLIQRHRLVLDTVQAEIASDELHALSISSTKTPAEVA